MKLPRHPALLAFYVFPSLSAWAGDPAPITDPRVINDHYRQVLENPEYLQATQANPWEKFGAWLLDFFQSLGRSMSSFKYAGELGRFSYFIMWAILILAGAALLYWGNHILLTRRASLHQRRQRFTGTRYFAPPESFEPGIHQAVGQGDWKAAFQSSWLRFLALLERNEIVQADRTRTNWEYLAQFRAQERPAEAVHLVTGLVHAYDLHIYGGTPIDAGTWNQMDASISSCLRLLRIEPPPAGTRPS